ETPAVRGQLEDAARIKTTASQGAGEMAEWLKAHAWKACLLERVTWVRIPLSPPVLQIAAKHAGSELVTILARSLLLRIVRFPCVAVSDAREPHGTPQRCTPASPLPQEVK